LKKIKRVLVYGSSSFLKKNETKSIIKYLSRKCSLVDIYALGEDLSKPHSKKYDLILSIGGDGIFLSASKYAYSNSTPIVGLNFGRIGFLADLDKKNLQLKIKDILEGNYIIDKRTLLSGSTISNDKKYNSIALNDIVINNKGTLKMIEMNIYVNENLITKQRSDGVIIATPTGSTAYAMSNGCPIVSPNSNVTCIVPIAPHSYGQRSVIVNNTDDILIEINKKSKLNSQVTFDGANNLTIENPDKIVIKRARRQLMIVHPCDYDYFNALAKKLKYEIKS
jgi:NAD+ kinase